MTMLTLAKVLTRSALVLAIGVKAFAAESADEAGLHVDPARLEAWSDSRLGLFVHWGPWSQTRIGYIWKIVEAMPAEEREQYFRLGDTFNPTRFDPAAWARAAREAGMKYVVFVTKHHDGFNNYDTALSDYKITSPSSPFARNRHADLTRAVVEAFRAEGLAIGLYYSHIDWHHPDGRLFSRRYPQYDPENVDRHPEAWRRFAEFQKGQLRELLTNYGKIDIVWFDISWPHAGNGLVKVTHPVVRKDVIEMVRMIRTLQPDAIFNDRGTDVYGGFFTPEQRVPDAGLPGAWETSITITNERGYWYKGEDVSSKTPAELVRTLVDVASKGGNLLLNVGPRPDGTWIPGEEAALAGLGEWLQRHGESIYATRRSPFLDLPWGRATVRDGRLYLHVLDWPADGVIELSGLQTPIVGARSLSDPTQPVTALEPGPRGPRLRVGAVPHDTVVSVIAVDLEGLPQVRTSIYAQPDGTLLLPTGRARLDGAKLSYNYGSNVRHGDYLEGFVSLNDRVSWAFLVERPGTYRVVLEYALQEGYEGSAFRVQVGGAPALAGVTRPTAAWKGSLLDVATQVPGKGEERDNRWTFKLHELGTMRLDQTGERTLTIEPLSFANGYLFYLKSVRLIPVVE